VEDVAARVKKKELYKELVTLSRKMRGASYGPGMIQMGNLYKIMGKNCGGGGS
jgi:hypothetical protein